MANKLGKVGQFNPQSQAVGNTTPAGGSKPTPQAHPRGSAVFGSSKPKSSQKLRG